MWIYNRSNVPIFVDSPTLAERQPSERHRVCKVLPGYCLKAFETQRYVNCQRALSGLVFNQDTPLSFLQGSMAGLQAVGAEPTVGTNRSV